MSAGPDDPVSIGRRSGTSLDTRSDLGYGRSSNGFHEPRIKTGAFPYVEKDDYAADADVDVDLEIDVLKRILNKFTTPYKSDDSLIGRSADHDAFVGGNKPIQHAGLSEIAASNSLVPFPTMYKKRIQVGGGVNSPFAIDPGQYPRTGTERGWAHAPEELGGPEGVNVTFDEYLSGEDESITKIRKIVRGIIDQQEEARNDD